MVKHKKQSRADLAFDIFNYTILGLIGLMVLYPLYFIIIASVSDPVAINAGRLSFYPIGFNLKGYQKIFEETRIWTAYYNTIFYTVVGTAVNIILTMMIAYPLSRKDFFAGKAIMAFIMFTMYFSGGMIPKYLLIKGLGLTNRFAVYILPCLITGFALIITRNFFMEIPPALEESAKIDGASNMRVLFGIYLPLSLPVMATIALWYGVDHWNQWMDNMLYVTKDNLYVLQYVLQQILISGQTSDMEMTTDVVVHTETMKMAALVVSLIPIVCSYPFLQKYFVKGMLVGSVKG